MKITALVSIVLILIVFLLPTGSCSKPDGAMTEDNSQWAQLLAEQFSPIIYLKNEMPKENYEPAPVETMIERQAVIYTTDDLSFTEEATIPSMKQYSGSSFYLDIPGISPGDLKQSIPKYKDRYEKAKAAGFESTVYARVMKPGDSKHTVVQYWIFYYYNDWQNYHEGDWELVELVFPDFTAEELVKKNGEPEFAAYSQHFAGQKLSWEIMRSKGLISGTHPYVYVAQGSHANYFTPGIYWSITDFDDTGLSEWKPIAPRVIMISEEDPGNERHEWLDFKGYWGEHFDRVISVRDMQWTACGPNGPEWGGKGEKSQRWQQPYSWAEGLAEYPDQFLASFFPELKEVWSTLAVFSIFSPAEIHVYDRYGNHAGLNEQGEFETQIKGAEYITPQGTESKTIVIPNADVSQGYSLIIKGKDYGNMDVKTQVPDAAKKVKRYLEYRDIPVTPTFIARLQFTGTSFKSPPENSVSVRDNETILEIDQNGNGEYESQVGPGTNDIVIIKREDLIPERILTLVVDGKGVVRPRDGYTYKENSTALIIAQPEKGWVFDRWGGDVSGTSPSLSVVMNGDKTIIAYFKLEVRQFSLTIGVEGKGTTQPRPGTYFFTEGSKVSIQAFPEKGYALAGWSGDYGNSPTLELTIDGNIAVTAIFRPIQTEPVIDQSNEPLWEGGWMNIVPKNRVGQSILTQSLVLLAVDVNIITANKGRGGDNITMSILNKGELSIASTSQYVQDGFDGWLRFEMPKGGINLPIGTYVIIHLEDTGKNLFGWKYAGDTYPFGSRVFSGQAQEGDFFFRTYSTNKE